MKTPVSLVLALCFTGCSFWEDLPVEEEKPPVVVPVVRSGGMVLVKAKDSSFEMGSNENQSGFTQPVHRVTFTHDFWMDTTEVTQGKFDQVMKTAYSGYAVDSWDGQYGKGVLYPVYGRNWYDAALFCNALSRQAGLDTVYRFDSITGPPGNGCRLAIKVIDTAPGYRLPTEAEWEYACRAGTKGEFYWGSGDNREYAWYAENSSASARPVANKKPNRFALHDMSGNVAEWCNDWYAVYGAGSAVNPTGPSAGNYRILRGGDWEKEAYAVSSSMRAALAPFERNSTTGFRTVRRKE
ncbi:MAG: SUMF1/EgtB/PvdO family nonheme iron enzyme [Chitinispirillaceae bacterium]|nr:SUMF1/EgtB/PvdO family nonheme iron enzyme [Chitinispirillaceae bacterium]